MESTHGHTDWVASDHPAIEHKEALANGTNIHVIVRQPSADHYVAEIKVLDNQGGVLHQAVKTREQDPGPASEVLKFAVDEAKRYAGGKAGGSLSDHHQATPI